MSEEPPAHHPAGSQLALSRRSALLGGLTTLGAWTALGGSAAVGGGALINASCNRAATPPRSPNASGLEGSPSATDKALRRIDTHQHFWTYSAEEYAWIEPGSPLASSFLPSDLAPQLEQAGVEGTIAVEARSHERETRRLLSLAKQHAFIRGVVGWLPLIDPAIEARIAQHAQGSKLRGLRHALFAEANPEYALRPDFNRGIAALERAGLTYDLLVVPANLPVATRLVDRHPNQRFVLDHLGKPPIRSGQLQPWRRDLQALAQRPNVFAKLSGLITEADPKNWKRCQLRPYLEAALELFTPQRLMFGSDWPVCTLAGGYRAWTEALTAELAQLSSSERARIWSGTAIEAYNLA